MNAVPDRPRVSITPRIRVRRFPATVVHDRAWPASQRGRFAMDEATRATRELPAAYIRLGSIERRSMFMHPVSSADPAYIRRVREMAFDTFEPRRAREYQWRVSASDGGNIRVLVQCVRAH